MHRLTRPLIIDALLVIVAVGHAAGPPHAADGGMAIPEIAVDP